VRDAPAGLLLLLHHCHNVALAERQQRFLSVRRVFSVALHVAQHARVLGLDVLRHQKALSGLSRASAASQRPVLLAFSLDILRFCSPGVAPLQPRAVLAE
jgi:hypothetical protein